MANPFPLDKELAALRQRVAQLEESELESQGVKEQLALFHKFVTASQEGLGWADLEGNIKYINPALTRMLELDRPEDKYGEPVTQFYDKDAQRRLAKEIFPIILEKGMWSGELDLHSVKGKVTPTLNSLFRLNGVDGNPLCFGNIVTDRTERKKNEEDLKRHRDNLEELVAARTEELTCINEQLLQQMLERKKAEDERRRMELKVHETQKLESLGILAGGIAHDFNNLLVGVLGNADLAIADLTPESPVRPRLNDILITARRLSELTNQMLAYSGKGKFVVEKINLSRLVEELSHLLEVCISKKVAIKFNLMEDPPALECDVSQIRQVVMNLITNASDAMGDSSGIVSISTGVEFADDNYLADVYPRMSLPEGNYVVLEVSDTGCGMDRKTIEKMFDPFFTTKSTGRGLGLAAVIGIVRGHSGGIKIYSEPGRGTTIKLLLPHADSAPMATVIEDPEVSDSFGTGTVLVVDDERTVRDVARMILKHAGFDVLTAADGQEAIELIKERKSEISVVLLDLTMPNMDGIEAFGEIRTIMPGLPVVLSSGYNEQDATSTFVGRGLTGFIQKPYSSSFLVSKIKESLEK